MLVGATLKPRIPAKETSREKGRLLLMFKFKLQRHPRAWLIKEGMHWRSVLLFFFCFLARLRFYGLMEKALRANKRVKFEVLGQY